MRIKKFTFPVWLGILQISNCAKIFSIENGKLQHSRITYIHLASHLNSFTHQITPITSLFFENHFSQSHNSLILMKRKISFLQLYNIDLSKFVIKLDIERPKINPIFQASSGKALARLRRS